MANVEGGFKGCKAAQADNMQRRAELERWDRMSSLASRAERNRFAFEGAQAMLGMFIQGMVDNGERDTEEYGAICGVQSLLDYALGDMQALQDDLYAEAHVLSPLAR